MAIYRSINIDYWQDGFILDLTPEEKYFYLYLMTNSKTTQCGIFEVPMKIMETETGYNKETIMKYINRFIAYEKIDYDQNTNEIFLFNWIKYNRPTSPKVLTCVEKELAKVKSTVLVAKLLEVCSKLNIKINIDKNIHSLSTNNKSIKEKTIETTIGGFKPSVNKDLSNMENTIDNTIYMNSRKENKNGFSSIKPKEPTNARTSKNKNDSIYGKPSEEQLRKAREL